MKKYLLATALIMISTSAMAQRIVTATGTDGGSRPLACRNAKENAQKIVDIQHQEEVIVSFSSCDCDWSDPNKPVTCVVEAKVVAK